jgi:hypothetical protein
MGAPDIEQCMISFLLWRSRPLQLLGVYFVSEDPKEREHLRRILSGASAEATTYRASA